MTAGAPIAVEDVTEETARRVLRAAAPMYAALVEVRRHLSATLTMEMGAGGPPKCWRILELVDAALAVAEGRDSE